MNDFVSNIIADPTIIGIIIGVLGIIIGWFSNWHFHIKQRKDSKSQPKYAIRTYNIIAKSDVTPDFFNIYDKNNHRYTSLSVSTICFWNGGLKPISAEDVLPNDPIKIVVVEEKVKIIGIEEVYAGEKGNNIKFSYDDKNINVNFDNIAENEGFVIKVFHTGYGSDDFRMEGSLKTGCKIVKKAESLSLRADEFDLIRSHRNRVFFDKYFGSFFFSSIIMASLMLLCFFRNSIFNEIISKNWIPIFLSVFLSASIIYSYFFYGLYKYDHKNIPKNFERFFYPFENYNINTQKEN